MPDVRRVPPGRAGRIWLDRRLATARRGVDLLDRKLRILLIEQERFRLLAEGTRAEWFARWRQADVWLARAMVLGGDREVRLSSVSVPAEATITWGGVMGVRYPVEATCHIAEPSGTQRVPGTAAVIEATAAHAAALRAAVADAAAQEASRLIQTEVFETRRRLRALSGRWVPRLERTIQSVVQALAELERAETLRMRWAAGHTEGRGTGTDDPQSTARRE